MGVKAAPVNTTYIILAVMSLGVAWYLKNEATKAAKAVGEAVNPVSQDNIFNQGFEAVGEAVTGQKDWSLGVWLANKLNPPEKYEKQKLEEMGY